MKKSSLVLCFVALSVLFSNAQNIFDYKNTVKFASYLYSKKNYSAAINEYNRAWFLENLSNASQKELFQSYLFSNNYSEGIETYKSKYPSLLANNDTIELIYGKLLISKKLYKDVNYLVQNSLCLNTEQLLYLTVSAELLAGEWHSAIGKKVELINFTKLEPLESIIIDIEHVKYKSPILSLSLSTFVPGLGKVYSGYWKDGLASFLVVSLSAWQAYRGFDLYGTSRPYTWIYAFLSTSFYLGNLYGSFKSANKKNYFLKHSILNKTNDTYSKMFCF
jgi:hypothetical protein